MMVEFELPETLTLQPSRKPPIGLSEFKAAMSSMAATVCVVSARRGEERLGRTVTAVLSLSAEPPAILISVDIVSRLADLIAKTGGFSLAMLAEDQGEIADAFAGRVAAEHRFNLGEWSAWSSGHPMLVGAVSTLDCEVIGSVATGTHVLFVGGIVDAETTTGRLPLVWQRQQYHGIAGLD